MLLMFLIFNWFLFFRRIHFLWWRLDNRLVYLNFFWFIELSCCVYFVALLLTIWRLVYWRSSLLWFYYTISWNVYLFMMHHFWLMWLKIFVVERKYHWLRLNNFFTLNNLNMLWWILHHWRRRWWNILWLNLPKIRTIRFWRRNSHSKGRISSWEGWIRNVWTLFFWSYRDYLWSSAHALGWNIFHDWLWRLSSWNAFSNIPWIISLNWLLDCDRLNHFLVRDNRLSFDRNGLGVVLLWNLLIKNAAGFDRIVHSGFDLFRDFKVFAFRILFHIVQGLKEVIWVTLTKFIFQLVR